MDTQAFNDWLLQQMRENGFSQADLARKSGLTRQAISNYVNQNRMPDAESLKALAYAFGLPAETAYQIVGLLPPPGERRKIAEQVLYFKASELTEEQIDDVIAYIEYIQQRDERKKRTTAAYKTKREGTTPPETVKK